jgi:EAL domain-containing protein (putative c-di-GMP-specific phosphodiesterase class I)
MVAEQSGLIGQLTEYVLDTALAQARAWEDEGRELKIAVNLSARCLTDLSLPGTVLDLLARHRIDAARLTLEVTETSVAEDPVRAEAVLSRLRGLGVRLSIDDFGTGYSSLASLKRFPVQEVKLDRQFLVDLEAGLEEGTDNGFDPEEAAVDIALLTAVVSLGHSLQLEIVAEGIETASAYAQLRELGVDVLQGFFMGRPAAPELLPWRFVFNGTGDSPSIEMWEPPAAEKIKSSQPVR